MAAPKGNTFALGNSGKPKTWQTVEELRADIHDYFEWCDNSPLKQLHNSQLDKETNKPIEFGISRPYTIEGLCGFLGCTRETLINYQKEDGYEEYFDAIKDAKNKIQQNKVERALSGLAPASSSIFDLKNNHGYKDKTEQEHSGELKVSKIEVELVKSPHTDK